MSIAGCAKKVLIVEGTATSYNVMGYDVKMAISDYENLPEASKLQGHRTTETTKHFVEWTRNHAQLVWMLNPNLTWTPQQVCSIAGQTIAQSKEIFAKKILRGNILNLTMPARIASPSLCISFPHVTVNLYD